VAVLVIGPGVALASYLAALARGRPGEADEGARQAVGRSILLGLEVLIVADIVQTITIDPTLENAAALGVGDPQQVDAAEVGKVRCDGE